MSTGALHPHAEVLDGPEAWTAEDFLRPFGLGFASRADETRRELRSAVAHARDHNGDSPFHRLLLSPQRFADDCAMAADSWCFAASRWMTSTRKSARLMYAGLGTHSGHDSSAESPRATTLYSVRDEGIRVEAEYGRTGVRFSKTNAAFDFHTDSPSRVAGHTPDFIGLLVLRTAKSGGESALVSGYAIHNILLRSGRMFSTAYTSLSGSIGARSCRPEKNRCFPCPVFAFDGRLTVRYLRFYITKGQEWKGEPLTEATISKRWMHSKSHAPAGCRR